MHFLLLCVFVVVFSLLLWYILRPWNLTKDVRTNRKTPLENESLPPLYPNGWIPVVDSIFIRGTSVKSFSVCGEEIAIFRGKDGKVHAVDAYCPHLGTNFSTGGTVVRHASEDCVQCPFHGWLFRASDGNCVSVPYAQDQKPPRGVGIKVWDCMEANGHIFIWYHAEGLEPDWYPPVIPEIESSKYVYRGRTEHIFRCHFQEIPRNGADIAHFKILHSPSVLLGGDPSFMNRWPSLDHLMYHHWSAEWSLCEPPYTHKAKGFLQSAIYLFGYCVMKLFVDVQQIGAAIVNMNFQGFGIDAFVIQSVTPIGPTEIKLVHTMYTPRGIRGVLFATFVLVGASIMVERDIKIWQEKRFCKNPKFVKEEKTLADFTRWFEQFYSEHSVRSPASLDW